MIEPPVDGQKTIPHGGMILLLAPIEEQLEEEKEEGPRDARSLLSLPACYGPSRLEIVVVQ